MTFNNNDHLYVKIISRIEADLDAPYEDGSKMIKGSAHYKNTLKKNKDNYEFLKQYIDSGEYLPVNSINFPDRDGGCLDDVSMTTVCVYNGHRLYSFYTSDGVDPIVCKNQEYYIVDFKIT